MAGVHSSSRVDERSRHGFSPIPRMPGERDTYRVLAEVQGETGFLLWRLLTDLETWCHAPGTALFTPSADAACLAASAPDHIRCAVDVIAQIWHAPESLSAVELANACAAVGTWAERAELGEVALQFAERAARLEDARTDRLSTAGRLCWLCSEPHRGSLWFQRALRLAQARQDYAAMATAHLGLGNLASALGRLPAAETHQLKAGRAAVRAGRRYLAGAAHHDLLLLYTRMARYADAWTHAKAALAVYKGDHPYLPHLAHDTASLWIRLGHFSAAHLVFERVLAVVERPSARMIVLANVARSAAACGDRLRYERAVREIICRMESGGAVPVFTLYYLAQAARTAGDWERAAFAVKGLQAAPDAYRDRIREQVEHVSARTPGDVDVLPDEGGEIEQAREILLRRMERNGGRAFRIAGSPVASVGSPLAGGWAAYWIR